MEAVNKAMQEHFDAFVQEQSKRKCKSRPWHDSILFLFGDGDKISGAKAAVSTDLVWGPLYLHNGSKPSQYADLAVYEEPGSRKKLYFSSWGSGAEQCGKTAFTMLRDAMRDCAEDMAREMPMFYECWSGCLVSDDPSERLEWCHVDTDEAFYSRKKIQRRFPSYDEDDYGRWFDRHGKLKLVPMEADEYFELSEDDWMRVILSNTIMDNI